MLVRAAILMASILIAGQAMAADTSSSARPRHVAAIQHAAPNAKAIAPLAAGQPADCETTDEYASEMKQIAVYAAIGNRDGVEIVSAQLRQFGVTRDQIQAAIDRTKVHGDTTTGAPQLRQSRVEFGSGRAMEVSY